MKLVNIIKAIAVVQSITAPALMIAGHLLNKKHLKTAGAIWCGVIALDCARLSCMLLNTSDYKSLIDPVKEEPDKCADDCPECPGINECADYKDRVANAKVPCSYMDVGCAMRCPGQW